MSTYVLGVYNSMKCMHEHPFTTSETTTIYSTAILR